MSDPAGPTSGDAPRETLERKLRELLPDCIPKEMELTVESLAKGVRTKTSVNDQIRSDFAVLRPLLRRAGTLCAAMREIGAELGRADGQPVRRMLDPPRRQGTKGGSPAESGTNSVSGETLAPAQTGQSQTGRRITWPQDRLREKEFIVRAVEEALMYLPAEGDQPHPLAANFLRELMNALQLTPESIAEALASDQGPNRHN